MVPQLTRRAALAGLSTLVALPVRAQTAPAGKPNPDAEEFAALAQPIVFDIRPNTGTLKETVQKGQELIWRGKEGGSDDRFKIGNVSVAFLRSETGGQVKMTFSCNISSLGYLTSDEAKLNVIVRAKGGASLHSWSFGISVKCGDDGRPLTPLTHEVPNDLAANVFTNVSTVEVAEASEPNSPGVKVQQCS
jgi:hypothetical protein